jgi:HD-GYP domain-containing protein (c-di-GMP phosphodiesterase class II)
MNDTQVLLSKIAALRQRLAEGLVRDAGAAAATLLDGDADPVRVLEKKVAEGARQHVLLDTSLRQLSGSADAALPARLTARAARLLRRAGELLGKLRTLDDGPLPELDEDDPAAVLYRETLAMTDTVLRTVQAFPEAPSAQLRLCEGLEVIIGVAADRLTALTAAVAQRRRERGRIDALAELLTALVSGRPVEMAPLNSLAEAVLDDTQQALPLRWLYRGPEEPARFAAAHSLNTAQVIARLTRHDPDWRGRLLEPILAALLHDVGMARVPAEVLVKPGPLTDEERRAVEAHTALGADALARLAPEAPWLAEAAAGHHERLDGAGYPAGLRDLQVKPLVRLLAVCDVYAALASPRPHRPALEPRTALTDTLLLAEKGALDRHEAERLLLLSFYPAGTAVELADGALGVVVATHASRRDLSAPARPVVALVTDSRGQPLASPAHVDLGECDGRSILRSLPAAERRELLGKRYPEWV